MNVFTLVMVNLWRHYIQGYKMVIDIESCIIYLQNFLLFKPSLGYKALLPVSFELLLWSYDTSSFQLVLYLSPIVFKWSSRFKTGRGDQWVV